jgi:hypothetical protein
VIRFYAEDTENLIEQFSMLGGRTGPYFKILTLTEAQNYGTELDSFGPRAEDD